MITTIIFQAIVCYLNTVLMTAEKVPFLLKTFLVLKANAHNESADMQLVYRH